MLELAALEAKHLEQRRNLDGKLIRVQQSKAFFMEEVAQATRRQVEAQVTALKTFQMPGRRVYLHFSLIRSCCYRRPCWLAHATVAGACRQRPQ